MPNLDEIQHDIIIIIATTLFVLFVTGIAGAGTVGGAPIVIPSA